MNLDAEIDGVVRRFRDDVAALAIAAAHDALLGAFTNRSPRRVARPVRGDRRDANELGGLRAKLLRTIEANPGMRTEQIGSALGMSTKQMALPIRQLVKAREISTKGQRRGTQYFPRSR